jgi:eukaryotic-like serine/threonine-protein kinase
MFSGRPGPSDISARSRPSRLPESSGWDDDDPKWLSREVDSMAAAWSRGQPVLAGEIIDRHPGIADEAAVRLIYEEVNLRRESGEDVRTTEVVRRYPRWREELEVLLGCDRLLRPPAGAAELPAVGEHLGPFSLRAELGQGASGKTYLASEPTLADRPVVLKVISDDQEEHLSLARLQHTNIIPLFSEHTFPERGLRALCMPYLGGTSLARVLDAIAGIPPADRRGRDIIHLLDRLQVGELKPVAPDGPYRRWIENVSYVEAICWIGTRLADALQEAHAHDLVHMDVKPSNVLIAADGSPMLLDFHLARRPVGAGERFLGRIGGTPGWMAPEHRAALDAVASGEPVPSPVDHRADIFALGLMLREALGGDAGPEGETSLRRRNPTVSAGLEDILRKCVAERPSGRYQDAASLADDLRRHLDQLPLRGVRNRPGERLRKKWRRQPGALVRSALWIALSCLALTLAIGRAWIYQQRNVEASLREEVRAAHRGHLAEELHRIAEQLRLRHGIDPPSGHEAAKLHRNMGTIWHVRHLLIEPPLDAGIERQIRADLLELVATWAQVRTRLAKPEEARGVCDEVLAMLDEARGACGPSLTLDRIRGSLAESRGRDASPADSQATPRGAYEHDDLGRSFLRSARFEAAAEQFRLSLEERPQDFWPNFYLGLCEYRLRRYDAAVSAFKVCIALAPTAMARAECYFNRGVAAEALGRPREALEDYSRALKQDPGLTAARLNHGILSYKAGRHSEAIADLRRALESTNEPKTLGRIHYNLGLVQLAAGDPASARNSADQAIALGDEDAWGLRDRLRRER